MPKTVRVSLADARVLWFDSAHFWLKYVVQADQDTFNDVLALLDWPEERKMIAWAARFGRGQVFTSAVIRAGVKLAELKIVREESERGRGIRS